MSSSVSEGAPAAGLKAFAVCAGLTALAVKQSPGRLVGDTKLDLVVDPGRFLGRALHLWDPSADFGLTQNQAYGYLFPMGPFFWLGRLVGLPPWLVQRLWWALLLCVAFLGMVKLCARLGVGTADSRVLAGVAFALSPRLLSGIGSISVESLPYCLAPWVLLPLIGPWSAASPRRAAARSAAAVLCMGAVNAAAVLAALPLAGLYLVTRSPGAARRRLIGWWCVCVAVATAWWTVPLVLLGRYSPPFLDFIETAATTTAVTSLVEVLRGTSDWVAYVAGSRGPTWPAGWALLTEPLVIFYTVLVATAGLVGLLRRDLPERRWLATCVLVGLAALTFGHGDGWLTPLAGSERHLLDGPLAPFRNVHKFDVVLRVPLMVGLAHCVGRLLVRDPAGSRVRAAAPRLGAVAVVLGAALPSLQVGLAPTGTWTAIPDYWTQASHWLDEHGPGADLLLPGSSFPEYLWGHTNDEPLQPLARRAWAVRGATPLTPAGTIRMLDAVEARLSAGRQSPGLALALRRAGIRHLLVRNDLDYGAAGSSRPLLVHEALVSSPGITRVASFGGSIGGGAGGTVVDEGLEVPYPALEVYEVAGPAVARASLSPLSDVVTVAGGPESLLGLEDLGLLGGRPAVLAADADGRSTDVLTDGLRKREVFFGRTSRNASATLTARDPYRLDAPAHDYLDPELRQHQTVARTLGALAVSSSSSASDPNALGGAQPEHGPSAAADGDPATWWSSDTAFGPARARWSLDLSAPTSLNGVRLLFHRGPGGATPASVRVAGDAGSTVVPVSPDGEVRTVEVPGGLSRHLSVTTESTRGSGFGSLGLAEVDVPGVTVARTLDTDRGIGRPAIVLTAAEGRRPSCFGFLQSALCQSTLASPGEEASGIDRTVHLSGGGDYAVARVDVVPRPGPDLDRLLAGSAQPVLSASSASVPDPLGSPAAAMDGDPGTTWRAAAGDRDPSLALRWARPQVLDRLVVTVARSAGASRARRVRLVSPEGTRTVDLDASGRGHFPRLRTAQVTLHLEDPALAASLDPYTQGRSLLPVGVSEVSLPGTQQLPAPDLVSLPCGSGPDIDLAGQMVPTSLTADRTVVRSLGQLPLTLCSSLDVRLAGQSRLRVRSTPTLAPVSVVLEPNASSPALPGPAGAPVATPRWGATERRVVLPERTTDSLLQIHENVNAGWQATLGGRRLTSLPVDGWQQGWVVPAGAAGQVRLSFAPDRTYRSALLGGGLLLLLLPGLALVRDRGSRPRPGGVVGPRRSSSLVDGVALGCLAVAGGPVALVAAPALLLVSRRRPGLLPGAVVACLVGAGAAVTARPWPSGGYLGSSSLVSSACAVAISALTCVVLPDRRMKGSSSQR